MTDRDSLRVEWCAGNQQWVVLGGGLPAGTAWAGYASCAAALREANAIADDIGVKVIFPTAEEKRP